MFLNQFPTTTIDIYNYIPIMIVNLRRLGWYTVSQVLEKFSSASSQYSRPRVTEYISTQLQMPAVNEREKSSVKGLINF